MYVTLYYIISYYFIVILRSWEPLTSLKGNLLRVAVSGILRNVGGTTCLTLLV